MKCGHSFRFFGSSEATSLHRSYLCGKGLERRLPKEDTLGGGPVGFVEQFGKSKDDDEMGEVVRHYLESRERVAGLGEQFEYESVREVIRRRDELLGMIGPGSTAGQIQWIAEQLEVLSKNALVSVADLDHGMAEEMISAASSTGEAARTVRGMVGRQREHDREIRKIQEEANDYCQDLRDETHRRIRERREKREEIESRKRSILCDCGRTKPEGNLYCIYCYDEYRKRG